MVIGLLAAISLLGCGASTGSSVSPMSSGAAFPPWQGVDVDIFPDQVDPAAVGLSIDAEPAAPRTDKLLRGRSQLSDVIGKVRVTTVTADAIGDAVTYHLSVDVEGAPIVDAHTSERSFELTVRPDGRGYPIVKAFDQRLRGLTFTGFLRRYAGPDGDAVTHFYLAADTVEVAASIKEAMAFEALATP
jgi:hypothetical protein